MGRSAGGFKYNKLRCDGDEWSYVGSALWPPAAGRKCWVNAGLALLVPFEPRRFRSPLSRSS